MIDTILAFSVGFTLGWCLLSPIGCEIIKNRKK